MINRETRTQMFMKWSAEHQQEHRKWSRVVGSVALTVLAAILVVAAF